MGYHIIERCPGETFTAELEGRTFTVPCIVEDDDGNRLLLTPGAALPAAVWHQALGAGAIAVVRAADGLYALSTTFADQRSENSHAGTYVLAHEYWSPYSPGMGYRDMMAVREGLVAPELPGGFVHLHTHGEHSALDGLSKMGEIVATIKADGGTAVAITDHGTCASHPDLAKACEAQGIAPIFGMEAYFQEDRFARGQEHRHDYMHLVIWAMNDVGLRNLWALSTEGYVDGFYDKKARIDWDSLERHQEGLMVSSACLRGPLLYPYLAGDEERALHNLAKLKKIFGDRFYVELHANQLAEQIRGNEWLVEVAERFDVPMVAVVDSHYAEHEDKEAHQVWLAVQTDGEINADSDLFAGGADYHLMTEAEVREALSYLDPAIVDEAVANTVRVAQRCTARMTPKSHNPVFSKASKAWPDRIAHDVDRLFDACMDRWDERTGGKTHEQEIYLLRFEREIGLIISKGFAGYFLMVADFVLWAKKNGIFVGPGRGSGGGSLVAYLLGITEIDPVESDLLFERFMTEGRTALPDFDIDFPTSKKQMMLGYVAQRWGADHIATVGTHMRLQSKGIINDVSRAIKSTLPEDYYVHTKNVSKIIGAAEAGTAGLGMSWEDLWIEHGDVLDPYREKFPDLFRYCDRLHGRLKSYGTHPAGVVIDPDDPLSGALPLRNGENGLVTQFDMEALEWLGFVKFDMLNLRTLDTLQETVDLIEQTTGRRVNVYDWRDDVEYADPLIFDEISQGWTLGIFQIETSVGTQMTRRFKPRTIAELADVITLVRPGPVRSGLTDTYFRRRNGEEEAWVPDPRLEPVLDKTYGCMVYQEDIMAATMVLAGYGSDEADKVRKILGKKKVELVLAEGEKFVSRASANNTDTQTAIDLWEQMAEFAKYSFNRAHAFAYAKLGFWTAWFKFHYPVQFLTSALSTVDDDRIGDFINEARRMGYAIQPPDINLSGSGFTATQMSVLWGLRAIKGIGEACVEAIIEPRKDKPYESFDDFLERKGSNCKANQVAILARIGAFDSLIPNRRGLELRIEAEKWAKTGTDCCEFKTEENRQISWIETKAEAATEHEVMLPCSYDWVAEPDTLGRTGKPVKRKPPVKKCTRGCRRFSPIELAEIDDIERYTPAEIGAIEMEHLGVYLSWTPFDDIDDEVRESLAMADDVLTGVPGLYPVLGVITSVRMKPGGDKFGRSMGWITVMTERGDLEMVVFSSVFEKYRKHLKPQKRLLMGVEKNSRGQSLAMIEN